MNLKQIGKVFTSKFVGTGPSSYEQRIYRAAVWESLRNTGLGEITGITRFTATAPVQAKDFSGINHKISSLDDTYIAGESSIDI